LVIIYTYSACYNTSKYESGVTGMSEFDALTGLYNREAFCKHAREVIINNPDVKYDIVISDFINFKHFNERYGVEAGDFLLIKTGEMLSHSSPDVICGRYGADRFVSLNKHLDDNGLALLKEFQLPEQARNELPVDSIIVKFGVCTNVDDSAPITVFCDRALSALQAVKHQYGKNLAIYDKHLGDTIKQSILIEENMKSSLRDGHFQVYYQPKQTIKTGIICGAEALVRWIHPKLGFMNPGDFIPQFENNGFICELDFYVWEQVLKNLAEWKAQGKKIVPISVNASRRDFDIPDLAERITALADKYGVEHSFFHLEVTESSYAESPDNVVRHIRALREAGFKVELDDFGSGFTSLSFLNDMDLDTIKIDMSILQKDQPESKRSVLLFVMQMAQMMKLTTVQEGVETLDQLERLKLLGCDRIQGYLCSKPLPQGDFEKLVFGE